MAVTGTLPAPASPHLLPISDSVSLVAGRTMIGLAAAAATSGCVTVVLLGRWGLFIDDALLAPVIAAFGFGALCWLMFRTQPRNGAVWALAWTSLFAGLALLGTAVEALEARGFSDPEAFNLSTPQDYPFVTALGLWFTDWPAILPFFLPLTLGILLFPDGRPPSRRWRLAGWASITTLAVMVMPVMWVNAPGSPYTYGYEEEGATQPELVSSLFGIGYMATITVSCCCLAALIIRYRRSDAGLRRQIRLAIVGFVGFIILMSGSTIVDALTDDGLNRGDVLLDRLLVIAAITFVVASFAVAILRFRLYDIDVIVSKAAVYLTFALFIAGGYVGLVVILGRLFGGSDSAVSSVVAMTIVAVMAQPVRRRLERWGNRIVFGTRATPYEVLLGFSRRAATSDAADLIHRVPALMVGGTSASQAAVWRRTASGFEATSWWPDTPDPAAPAFSADRSYGADTIPVSYDGELLGGLTISIDQGDELTVAEERLIGDLSSGLGLVFRNEEMTADLRRRVVELEASRRRLLRAAYDARRRLELEVDRGPHLHLASVRAALAATSEAARRAEATDVAELLHDVEADVEDAVTKMRDFARGVFPRALESDGLAAALREEASHVSVPTRVEASSVGRHRRDIEAAVYFAVLEALQNVSKHAEANAAVVRLREIDDELEFRVEDDGVGFDAGATGSGAGIANMQDRIDTIGGDLRVTSAPGLGTTVRGRVPLHKPRGPCARRDP